MIDDELTMRSSISIILFVHILYSMALRCFPFHILLRHERDILMRKNLLLVTVEKRSAVIIGACSSAAIRWLGCIRHPLHTCQIPFGPQKGRQNSQHKGIVKHFQDHLIGFLHSGLAFDQLGVQTVPSHLVAANQGDEPKPLKGNRLHVPNQPQNPIFVFWNVPVNGVLPSAVDTVEGCSSQPQADERMILECDVKAKPTPEAVCAKAQIMRHRPRIRCSFLSKAYRT